MVDYDKKFGDLEERVKKLEDKTPKLIIDYQTLHGRNKSEIKQITIVLAGQNEEYIWFDIETFDGQRFSSCYFKGEE